jgi:hypothetical protein
LLIAVRGNTLTLIPLFAIGVFTGFTLSQSGLVIHWRRFRPPNWRYRAAINGLGAIITAIATIVFLFTKFTEGAWVVVVAVPAFILLFVRIHTYYERTARTLELGRMPLHPEGKPTLVIVPITGISRLTEHALCEALSLGQEVIAVTVVLAAGDEGQERQRQLETAWAEWDPGVTLRVLHTEYSSVVDPLVKFIDEERASRHDQIVVLIPVVIPDRIRYRILHNQIDVVLSTALRSRTDLVVARVRMPLDTHGDAAARPSLPAEMAEADPQPHPST